MGNYFSYLSPEPYTIRETEKETEADDKNAYYWFGLRDEDIEMYRLLEEEI